MAVEELIATPTKERVRFANADGDVAIFSAVIDGGREVALKGPVSDLGPQIGLQYLLHGRWVPYTNRRTGEQGEQFAFNSCVRNSAPKGRDATVAYLSGCNGVGLTLANRIFDKYGEGALDRCRRLIDDPDGTLQRFPAKTQADLANWLIANERLENAMAEVVGLLKNRGMPRNLPERAVRRWGASAGEIIRKNPYRLMEFSGVGFRRADALYMEFKLNPTSLKRQALCGVQAIRDAPMGDTWHYCEVFYKAVRQSTGGADANPKRALKLALRAGLLRSQYTDGVDGLPEWDGTVPWLAEQQKAMSERRVVRETRRLLSEQTECCWETVTADGCSEHQADAANRATVDKVGVLAGSPGTGKTYTIAQIVRQLAEKHNGAGIFLAAPTGKAAVRMTQAMSDAGVPFRASTIHSLLQVESAVGGGWRFAHHKGNPLSGRHFILDEASMIGTDLLADFLQAVPDGGHVLLVGDTNQLLPVGHGAPMRDYIAAGVPTGELTEIVRNSGGIVEACAAIRDGESFSLADNLAEVSGDNVVSVVERSARMAEVPDASDIQVLVAVNDKGSKCRKVLNKELQAGLNPHCPAHHTGGFLLGDKVICLQNGWFKEAGDCDAGAIVNDDGEVRVANGDMGLVVEVVGKRMRVELSAPRRRVWVPLGVPAGQAKGSGSAPPSRWDLAYAISVHKSQGSEFPVVVVVLDESGAAGQVGDRAWIYTAISRAKNRCYLWGDLQVARRYAKRNRINQRKTFLRELLQQ